MTAPEPRETVEQAVRRRIDDWFMSMSETYAGPVGGDLWRVGLTRYVVTVLAAEMDSLTSLCSQCGEMPSVMVKIGTTDGWCEPCLDQASDGEQVAVLDDGQAARDRSSVERVIRVHEYVDIGGVVHCAECDRVWPCDTIAALAGQQDPGAVTGDAG